MLQHTPIRRKGAIAASAILLLLLAEASLGAQQAGRPSSAVARSVPAMPDPRHVFVLDSAHLLSGAEIAALQDSALALQRGTGADIAFVTLPTLHGGAVQEAALTIGRQWKVGSAGTLGDPTRARGLVVLYVPDKSTVAGSNLRVEVGRGLEGAITDGGGSRQIIEAMKPGLRAKRYGEGFLAGFGAAAALVRAENAAAPRVEAAPVRPPEGSGIDWAFVFPILLLVVVGGGRLVIAFLDWRREANDPVRPRPRRSASSDSGFWTDSSDSGAGSSSGGDSGGSSDSGSFGGGGDFSGGGSDDTV